MPYFQKPPQGPEPYICLSRHPYSIQVYFDGAVEISYDCVPEGDYGSHRLRFFAPNIETLHTMLGEAIELSKGVRG